MQLTKNEAYQLGFEHGHELAIISGSADPGCDGWEGMLINADPGFVEDKLPTSDLLAEYCRGCQAGANEAIESN